MNTLLESTTCENLKTSGYLRNSGDECCVGYEYTRSANNSFATAGAAICDKVQSRKSARLEKRPLAPVKPPMRLVGKRVRRRAYTSFRTSK